MGVTAINGVAITASLATSASKVEVVNNDTGAGNLFVPFFGSQTGVQYPGTDSAFTWNPIANTLWIQGNITASNITASTGFFGTASWATRALTASRAQQIETINTATNATFYPTFVDSANGTTGQEIVYTDADITYNPSTNEFRAGLLNLQSSNTVQNTIDANLTIDAAVTKSVWWAPAAGFAANRILTVNNLTQGRSVRVYIRNVNASARTITFSGSTTTTGHSSINMAVGAGAASATIQTFAGSSGTGLAWIENMGGFIIGGIM